MFVEPLFWVYVAATVGVVWCLPPRVRPSWIAAASFAYLLTLDAPSAVGTVAASVLVFAVAPRGAAPGGQRVVVGLVVAAVVSLAVFKCLPPLARALWPASALGGLALPLGISYFSFKLIHYTVETSRGRIADRSLGNFLAWMLLVPTFSAGPIERFDHFLVHREAHFNVAMVVEGLTRIAHGVIKKFLVAEWLVHELLNDSRTIGGLIAHIRESRVADVRLFLVCAFLYAYFEFAGYSDMAIGTSRLLGYGIQENFDSPLLARNISTFWRKWHMTLAGWCQSYIYMPVIGMTRNPYAAVFATFFVMGMWHATNLNYLAWALYQACGVSVALTWNRWRMKRGYRPATTGWRAWAGVPVTLLFFAGSLVFSTTHELGLDAAARLGARALGLRAKW